MSNNPLLEDLNSGDITSVSIALPTMGYFYPKGSGIIAEDADPADLEVKPLGIMAELVAKDPFVLASGRGVPKILRNICPSILKPEEMCEVDIQAIMIACRLASYGSHMELTHVCENPNTEEVDGDDGKKVKVAVCNHKNKLDIDLNHHIQRYAPLEDMESLLLILPEIRGQQVHMKPLCYKSALTILKNSVSMNRVYESIEKESITKLIEDESMMDAYERMIENTSETRFVLTLGSIFYVANAKGEKVFDESFIAEWLEMVPPTIVDHMQRKAKAYNEKLNDLTKIKYTCINCGHENTASFEVDPQKIFFYSPEASTPEMISSDTSKMKEKTGRRPSRTSPRSVKRMKERSNMTTSSKHPQGK